MGITKIWTKSCNSEKMFTIRTFYKILFDITIDTFKGVWEEIEWILNINMQCELLKWFKTIFIYMDSIDKIILIYKLCSLLFFLMAIHVFTP